MHPDKPLNVREAAARLGVHENTVRNWQERGLLRCMRLPGSGYRRFPYAEVERMRHEMMTQFAPATEMPTERTVPTKRGRIVEGDSL